MLIEIYIEALLFDEEAADQVWEAWDKGEIEEMTAFWAWWTIAALQQPDDWYMRTFRYSSTAIVRKRRPKL